MPPSRLGAPSNRARLLGILLKEPIIASHPVSMKEVGSPGFFFLPKRHFSPFQSILALVAATRTTGNPSPRRQEDRRDQGDMPPLHGWRGGLASVRGSQQLPFVIDAHENIAFSLPLFEVLGRELGCF